MTTHGRKQTLEYAAWARMKQACYNPNSSHYPTHGALGIIVCDRWRDSFKHFYEDMRDMPATCNGIDRLDKHGDFFPTNCFWTFKAKGRKPLKAKLKKVTKSHGKIKNAVSICLWLEKDQLDFIKRQALQRSIESGVSIEANQLIREILRQTMPFPKQLDMFEEKK